MDIFIVLIIVFFLLLSSIKQINQYERGAKFTIGKFSTIMQPGWRIVVPIFQSYQKVDMRVKAVDVPDQNAITRDRLMTSLQINQIQ